ncbi:MAG: gluconokinase [Archangium sp.]|nr:gluconokinase [Archangium sp.]MDP3151897.1 gluconokinase [Archangium sp.]MDP3571310.1 gluconokinase [Archangium sp.]
MILVLMGVTGSGKTTVGRLLAAQLAWRFIEGDDLHPPGNIAKLSRAIALDDEDRRPWLDALREAIAGCVARQQSAVVSCSALQHRYRERLRVSPQVVFVHLVATPALIRSRLRTRTGHFMHPALVDTQYELLDEAGDAREISADAEPEAVAAEIRRALAL